MKKETLTLLKQVVCLLDNGVKPYQLQIVLYQFDSSFRNGVSFEFERFVNRIDLFFDEDFDKKTLKASFIDLDKVIEK